MACSIGLLCMIYSAPLAYANCSVVGIADVAGVLVLSAIPFAAVQALADSDLGSKLQAGFWCCIAPQLWYHNIRLVSLANWRSRTCCLTIIHEASADRRFTICTGGSRGSKAAAAAGAAAQGTAGRTGPCRQVWTLPSWP